MTRLHQLGVAVTVAMLALGSACSSSPEAKGPAWIQQPARTVDGGYIIYVGSGEDQTEQKAQFKAEGQALQDLANECSFAPKGTRVEDHYDTDENGTHRDYAKVGVDFQSCEEAKAAVSEDDIHRLANVATTDQIQRYQQMMNEPPPPPITEVASNEGTPPPPSEGGGTVVVVRDEPTFFIARSQVMWVKQTVILTPPPPPGVAPPPPSPQLAAIGGPVREIRTYEQANPTLRTTQPTFSQIRPRLGGAYAPAARAEEQEHPRAQARQPQQRRQPPRRPPPKSKRKKRKWH